MKIDQLKLLLILPACILLDARSKHRGKAQNLSKVFRERVRLWDEGRYTSQWTAVVQAKRDTRFDQKPAHKDDDIQLRRVAKRATYLARSGDLRRAGAALLSHGTAP